MSYIGIVKLFGSSAWNIFNLAYTLKPLYPSLYNS